MAWRAALGAAILAAGPCLALPARAADGAAGPATTHATALRQFDLATWSTRQGLPQNSVRRIVQTREGYLWFSTWEGLVRYDGSTFRVFDRGNTASVLDNAFCGLDVDRLGWLWAGDSRGNIVTRLPDGSWRSWPRPPGAPSTLIQALRGDGLGGVWVLYQGHGVGHFDPQGRFRSRQPTGVPAASVSEYLELDPAGGVWVGGLRGALRIGAADAASDGLPADGLPPGPAWPVRTRDGGLWFVAADGLFRLESGRAVLKHRLPGMGRITALVEDHRGWLWVGTESNGVLRISDRGVEQLAPALAVPDGRVLSLAEDMEGSIWVGSNAGLARLRATGFANYGEADGLSGTFIRDVLEDHGGRLWIGSGSGLDRMEPDGRISPVRLPSTTGRAPEVLALAESADGTLWAGTYADGLYRIGAGGGIRMLGEAAGLPPGSIRAIEIGPDGRIWVGTQRGVGVVDPVTLRAQAPATLPGEGREAMGQVDSLAIDRAGAWVGTVNGLWRLGADGARRVDLEAMGGGRSILALTRLGDALWICTDRGVYRLRDGRLAHVGLEQGLGMDTVFAMVGDRLGHVWLTGNRGIWRVPLTQLQAVADGSLPRLAGRHFDETDGMASAQANGGSSPSAILRRDGTIWVATSNGLSTVDPARIDAISALPAPMAVVDTVAVNARVVAVPRQARPVRLRSGDRLSISYVGITSVLADRIVYRTRLEGLDARWVERERRRSIDIAGLMPGRYLLHIEAARPGGAWGAHEATLALDVMPLWWQRLSVRLIAAAVVLGGLVAALREAARRPRRRELALGRLVAQRTGELQRQTDRLLDLDRQKSALLEQVRLQSERLARQALEDPLTGLPNRRAFDLRIAEWSAGAERGEHDLSLVLIDLDHFKAVNDRHSHQVGDLVLCEAARLIGGELGDPGFAARTGGEEFTVLLAGGDAPADAFCVRLREAFHRRPCWGGIEDLRVTFSAGVARHERGLPGAMLVARADDALYRAKRAGRDRACLWQEDAKA